MGKLAAAANGSVLRVLLGSCLGLVLYDRRQKTGGLAHIVLPQSNGFTKLPAKFVDTAIPALIREMEKVASRPLKLNAKIAGGSNMFADTGSKGIGQRNIEAVQQWLNEFDIPIEAQHLGGMKGRRMLLYTETGRVTIEVVGAETIELG
jgi:chemotaxis protein CheD